MLIASIGSKCRNIQTGKVHNVINVLRTINEGGDVVWLLELDTSTNSDTDNATVLASHVNTVALKTAAIPIFEAAAVAVSAATSEEQEEQENGAEFGALVGTGANSTKELHPMASTIAILSDTTVDGVQHLPVATLRNMLTVAKISILDSAGKKLSKHDVQVRVRNAILTKHAAQVNTTITHNIEEAHATFIRDMLLQCDANTQPTSTSYDKDKVDSFDPSKQARDRRGIIKQIGESANHEYGLLNTSDMIRNTAALSKEDDVSKNRKSTAAGTKKPGASDIRGYGLNMWETSKTPFAAWRSATNQVHQCELDLFAQISHDLYKKQSTQLPSSNSSTPPPPDPPYEPTTDDIEMNTMFMVNDRWALTQSHIN
jgi:hypothetical protein